jgi:arylsulfatase A-like enzyme
VRVACYGSRLMGVASVFSRRTLRAFVVLATLAAFQWALLGQTTSRPAEAQSPAPPNIVLIVTDDQRFDSLHVMPQVQRLMRDGMTLRRAIVTNPLCCPSRATILTGRYSHTTNVYTNVPPFGGWSGFQASESDTIATALHDVGYRTALIGKYINGYGGDDPYVPPGWDRWLAILGASHYYNYSVLDSQRGTVNYGSAPRHYSTDVFRRQAVWFIRSVPQDSPLFLMVTPYAPHSPYVAAKRHEGDLISARVRLGPAVNEADVSDKPAYIASGRKETAASLRTRTRDQWESLLAVDDLVGKIRATLEETGRADNTLIIFTSDNGFSNHEHRWTSKQVPYEESIRVPMIVSMPGQIPADTVSDALVSNVDLAPTLADFGGATLSVDGVSLRPLLTDVASSVRDSVLLEHLDWSALPVPTYCGVRTPGFTFVHYATGEEELYDLSRDPKQLVNVAAGRPNKTNELRALTQSLCQPLPPDFSW